MLSSRGAPSFGSRPTKLHMVLEGMFAFTKCIHVKSAEAEEGHQDDEDAYRYVPLGTSGTHWGDLVLVSRLKSCTTQQDLSQGRKLHDDIRQKGLLGKNLYVGNALVHMYAKCGALANAQDVFDELPLRDVVSWTSLVSGYAQHGCGEEALALAEQMQAEGFTPDTTTFACILKACGITEAVDKGKEIHVEVVKKGFLDVDSVLGNALLDMYLKCHALVDAQNVFDKLFNRNVASWTMLIQGYYMDGHGEKAIKCYEQMQHEGLSPNALTFALVLKACGNIGAAEKGEQIHGEISKKGLLGKNSTLGSALVDMYAKSGATEKAQKVFEELHVRDESSWSALIAGYCQHDCSEEAFVCFEQMQSERLSLDARTLSSLLHSCSSTRAVSKGELIHAQVLREGLLGILGNGLVDMYAKCGALAKAHLVFEELPNLDVVSWTALISGYAQHGHAEEAFLCFEHMQGQGFLVDVVTFSCMLKVCGSIAAAEKGLDLHSEIARKGFLGKSIVLGNALIDFYAKCGALARAQEVFDELSIRDIFSWNTLIAAYAESRHGEMAFNCFEKMQEEGLSPDEVTFSCLVKACSTQSAAEKGEEVHAEIARLGLLERNSLLGNALVDMYSKCGAVGKAHEVFDGLPVRGVVSWTALIEGYCHCEHNEQALHMFEQMQGAGFSPNAVTFLCALHACSILGAAEKGEELHQKIVRQGLLEGNSALGAALVDMYAKCGALNKAQEVFDKLSLKNVVSWTALMAGYAQIGKHESVSKLFKKMVQEGADPNLVTYVIVLNACSHLGLVDEGEMHFKTMEARYGIIPSSEHHTCMVDLFGRAGLFGKAMSMMKRMPSDCLPAWFTLLGACRKWGNVKLARFAFEQIVRLDREFDSAYVCMRNIYVAANMQEEAYSIEAMRVRNQAGKEPQDNWMDESENATSFIALDWRKGWPHKL